MCALERSSRPPSIGCEKGAACRYLSMTQQAPSTPSLCCTTDVPGTRIHAARQPTSPATHYRTAHSRHMNSHKCISCTSHMHMTCANLCMSGSGGTQAQSSAEWSVVGTVGCIPGPRPRSVRELRPRRPSGAGGPCPLSVSAVSCVGGAGVARRCGVWRPVARRAVGAHTVRVLTHCNV